MFKTSLFKTATAVTAAAAMLTSAVPAYAAAAEDPNMTLVSDAITAAFADDEVTGADQKAADFIADGSFTLDLSAEYKGDPDSPLNISASYAQDFSAGEQSLSGALSSNGLNITASEYLDGSHIALSLPILLEKPVSYDYTNDNITGFLEDYSTYAVLANNVIRGLRDELGKGVSELFKINPEFTAQLEATVGDKTLDPAGTKEVRVGADTVTADGYTLNLTSEDFAAIGDVLVNGPLTEDGSSLKQILENIQSFAGLAGIDLDVDGDSLSEILDQLQEILNETPDLTYTFYVADGILREYELVGAFDSDNPEEQHTLTFVFGGEDIAWHNTELLADGEAVMNLVTTVDGTSYRYALNVEDEEVLSYSFDTASGAFAIEADGMDSVSGVQTVTDDTYELNVDQGDVSFTVRISDKAAIEKIEGETLELTTADAEETQNALASLGALVSGFLG